MRRSRSHHPGLPSWRRPPLGHQPRRGSTGGACVTTGGVACGAGVATAGVAREDDGPPPAAFGPPARRSWLWWSWWSWCRVPTVRGETFGTYVGSISSSMQRRHGPRSLGPLFVDRLSISASRGRRSFGCSPACASRSWARRSRRVRGPSRCRRLPFRLSDHTPLRRRSRPRARRDADAPGRLSSAAHASNSRAGAGPGREGQTGRRQSDWVCLGELLGHARIGLPLTTTGAAHTPGRARARAPITIFAAPNDRAAGAHKMTNAGHSPFGWATTPLYAAIDNTEITVLRSSYIWRLRRARLTSVLIAPVGRSNGVRVLGRPSPSLAPLSRGPGHGTGHSGPRCNTGVR
jgi:hypothetical protein